MATELGGNSATAAQIDPRRLRHPLEKDDLALNSAGQALLASIDEAARPKALAAAFPRIVNRMAQMWKAPLQMDRCFEDLLTDKRGNRQGFPLGVLMELCTLKDYYQSKVFPMRQGHDVWAVEERPKGR
jgi:hypothetical protein